MCKTQTVTEARHVERIQIQPTTITSLARVFLVWSTSARVFLESSVARCQELLDPRGGEVAKALVARWFTMVLNHHKLLWVGRCVHLPEHTMVRVFVRSVSPHHRLYCQRLY